MKRIVTLVSFVFVSLFLLAGCKTIEIKNGEVPEKYMELALPYAGVYHGKFEGLKGELEIKFNGNQPVVLFRSDRGNDLIGENCESSIGHLKEVSAKEKDGKVVRLKTASFSFDANKCDFYVQGNRLNLTFKEKGDKMTIQANIFAYWEQWDDCFYQVDQTGVSREFCRDRSQPVYLWGKFTRR